MSFEDDTRPVRNEGNYLRKSKRMFHLSAAGNWMLDRLSHRIGINRSGCIEVAIRRLYRAEIGEVPDVEREGCTFRGRIVNKTGNY